LKVKRITLREAVQQIDQEDSVATRSFASFTSWQKKLAEALALD
jgi:hypothetical protein